MSAYDWVTWGWVSALVVLGMAVVLWAIRHRMQRRVDELEDRLHLHTSVLDARQFEINRLEMELATSTQRLKKLKRLVAIDPLTGIANRRHFDRTLEREVRRARREAIPISVIFCDIDGFKAFNDTQGHARGDEALTLVAQTLAETFRRGSELAARYGGEEFVVVLPGVDVSQASLFAERLRRQIWCLGIPFAGAPVGDRLTISAGVASLTSAELASDASLLARAPEVLLNSADAALYRAKCLGRNRVAVKTASGLAIVAVDLAS